MKHGHHHHDRRDRAPGRRSVENQERGFSAAGRWAYLGINQFLKDQDCSKGTMPRCGRWPGWYAILIILAAFPVLPQRFCRFSQRWKRNQAGKDPQQASANMYKERSLLRLRSFLLVSGRRDQLLWISRTGTARPRRPEHTPARGATMNTQTWASASPRAARRSERTAGLTLVPVK